MTGQQQYITRKEIVRSSTCGLKCVIAASGYSPDYHELTLQLKHVNFDATDGSCSKQCWTIEVGILSKRRQINTYLTANYCPLHYDLFPFFLLLGFSTHKCTSAIMIL